MLNLLSDAKGFTDTGYFFCALGLIYVYGLILLVWFGSFLCLFFASIAQKDFQPIAFISNIRFVFPRFNCKRRKLIL